MDVPRTLTKIALKNADKGCRENTHKHGQDTHELDTSARRGVELRLARDLVPFARTAHNRPNGNGNLPLLLHYVLLLILLILVLLLLIRT